MNYAVMPIADYVGACDSIREKTGKTDPIKSGELAEQVGKIYESGKEEGRNSMVDPTKIIEKTASGIGSVSVDDVSEIPHEIKVQLSSDTITDFSGVNVTAYKNLYTGLMEQGSFDGGNGTLSNSTTRVRPTQYIKLDSGTYTLLTDEDKDFVVYVYDTEGTFIKAESKTGWSTTNLVTFTLADTRLIKFAIRYLTNTTIVASDVKFLVLYEENPKSYTPNADGTVEGITSLSPCITLQSNIEGVGITMTYRKSYGMQTEWDRFWDVAQQNGTRYVYDYCFAGHFWNNATFRPKYDIKPVGGSCVGVFRFCDITDLENALEKAGITFDTSSASNFESFVANSQITTLPLIDLSSATTAYCLFYWATKLETVRKVILPNKAISWSSAFAYCSSLKNIEFEGTLHGNSIDLKQSPLTKESIISVINALSTTSTSQTLTLKQTAVNNAFETSSGTADGSESEEWLNLVATKPNWTISLA